MVEIARALAAARRDYVRMADYPGACPQTMADAYRIQMDVIAELNLPIAGWKVGITSEAARLAIGVAEPISGPVLARDVFGSPARLSFGDGHMGIVEAELAVEIGKPLLRRHAPFSRADIAASARSVRPVFEIATKRLPGGLRERAEWLVADGAMNEALVVGPGCAFGRVADLSEVEVTVRVNGSLRTRGRGANALGHPMDAMVWLANHLARRGVSLMPGDIVATGLLTDLVTVASGDQIDAEFAGIGSVSLAIE